ncbi:MULTISPECIES: pilus assembly protein PilB [unclassified Anabaena]|uniref:GspE/PulE/PilB domain-containing protein n=1 Tax=unclassified Anabaena TaxID=2619674 RepID=UPI0008299521|nr:MULTISPECIES: pilus assembly protein PilB [unclassified Anabaena]
MWSSEGKPADTGASRQQLLQTTPNYGEQEPEPEQIFQLIDSLLSFEACLYHQILPLRIENNQLSLGMVHPEDSGALDYVSRIVSYLNYIMVTQAIAADTHRNLLSAYLNYKNTFPLEPQPAAQPTLPGVAQQNTQTTAEQQRHSPNTDHSCGQSTDCCVPPTAANSTQNSGVVPTNNHQIEESVIFNSVTVLQVDATDISSSLETLVHLPPKKLLEELLGRVLSGGIGRLYLERQPYQGRILWSDNGVVQTVLENLPLSVFQGVLNELKRFAAFPVTRLTEPRQIEKECLYQQNLVLLRIRVMPGVNGEEATLQVLRGAALKFYQKQQLAHLRRDVIGIAQQLSHKLHELHQRLLLNPSRKSEQSEAITALNRLVENLDQQIKTLTANKQLPRDDQS